MLGDDRRESWKFNHISQGGEHTLTILTKYTILHKYREATNEVEGVFCMFQSRKREFTTDTLAYHSQHQLDQPCTLGPLQPAHHMSLLEETLTQAVPVKAGYILYI